jgi:hypothetical protein
LEHYSYLTTLKFWRGNLFAMEQAGGGTTYIDILVIVFTHFETRRVTCFSKNGSGSITFAMHTLVINGLL